MVNLRGHGGNTVEVVFVLLLQWDLCKSEIN